MGIDEYVIGDDEEDDDDDQQDDRDPYYVCVKVHYPGRVDRQDTRGIKGVAQTTMIHK